jgi:hypothetical protein
MSARPVPDTDAAMALGMAATAMPFARSAQDEAERWLRVLRLHGEAGAALQALGVSEGPLEAPAGPEDGSRPDPARVGGGDVTASVTEAAARLATERGAQTLGTGDVLLAVMQVYGEDFDRVLRVHGTDRQEVLERVGRQGSGDSQRSAT